MNADPQHDTKETAARWFDRLERRRQSTWFDRLVRRRRTLLRELKEDEVVALNREDQDTAERSIAGAAEQLDEIAREIAEDGPVEAIHD